MSTRRTAIIGAGPAGLTAAYQLQEQGAHVVVLEADPVRVGGIAKRPHLQLLLLLVLLWMAPADTILGVVALSKRSACSLGRGDGAGVG